MIWFFVWLVFAAAVLTFMGWSTNITLAQRRAWTEFAAKYKLEVAPEGKGPFAPVSISGIMHGRQIYIYVQPEIQESRKLQDRYVHVEVFLKNTPPTACILAKRPLPSLLADLSLPHPFTLNSPDWPNPAVAMTDDPIKLANWMTGRTLSAFKSFMESATRFDQPMLIHDGSLAFLLWRTADPLRDPRQLNALLQKLYAWAKEMDGQDAASAPAIKANPSTSSVTDSSDNPA